jgi:hypothetical protein
VYRILVSVVACTFDDGVYRSPGFHAVREHFGLFVVDCLGIKSAGQDARAQQNWAVESCLASVAVGVATRKVVEAL